MHAASGARLLDIPKYAAVAGTAIVFDSVALNLIKSSRPPTIAWFASKKRLLAKSLDPAPVIGGNVIDEHPSHGT